MKSIIILSCMLFLTLFQGLYGSEYDMKELNKRLKNITDKKLHIFISAIEIQQLFWSHEYSVLQVKCSTDWKKIIDNFEFVDGGDEERKLIIFALAQLSAQDYMTVIESLVTKYESGTTSEEIVNTILYPHGRMGGFVRDNFNHSRVIAVLNRIKAKSNDASFEMKLDRVLTGEAKMALDHFREGHQGMAEGDIPIILLPAQ